MNSSNSHFLRLALQAHQRGSAAEAKHLYEKQLALHPKDPNALQLYGMLLMALGDYSNALFHMQGSLELEPSQAHVWNNLGSCYKKLNNISEAKHSFRKALDIEVDLVEPLQNLLNIYLSEQASLSALEIAEAAFRKTPANDEIRRLYARASTACENYDTAITQYRFLLNKHPNEIRLKNDLAIALRLNGEADASLQLLQEVADSGTSNFALFHNMANAMNDLGKIDDAISYYKKAIQINPSYVDSHINLNNLLWESDNQHEFLSSFEQFIISGQSQPLLMFAYVGFLYRVNRCEDALRFLNSKQNELNRYSNYHLWLAKCLFVAEQYELALTALRSGANCSDVMPDYKIEYARQLLESGFHGEAEAILVSILQEDPNHQGALAYLSLTKSESLRDEVSALSNYSGLVKEYDLTNYLQEACGADYFKALANLLRSLHQTRKQPLEQTLINGTQTHGQLFDNDSHLLQTLSDIIYIKLKEYRDSGFSAVNLQGKRVVNSYEIAGSWSVELSSTGFHTPHFHEQGCLSAVFYVDLPDDLKKMKNAAGNLQFGTTPFKRKQDGAVKHEIMPEVGKLVLFPSYIWHATSPFQSSQSRLTISFDVTAK